jgi:uncharacterized membrane-anchored protein YjiN (DUF445 family)
MTREFARLLLLKYFNNFQYIYERSPLQRYKKMKTEHLGNLSLLTCAGCWIATEICFSAGFLHGNWRIISNAFEAGTVGSLADWFAVSALFREIPIPVVRKHTNIIAKNRHRITDSIADMVQNKWLSSAVVREKLEKTRMTVLAMELLDRENASLKEYIVCLLRRLVEGLDDEEIVKFLEGIIKGQLTHVEFARSLGGWMHRAIDSSYHDEIWELLLESLHRAAQSTEIREYLARKLWEAAGEEKGKGFLKKMFIGAGEITGGFDYYSAADTLVAQFKEALQEAKVDSRHLIRQKFDKIVVDFAKGLEEGLPDATDAFNRFKGRIILEADLKKMLGKLMCDLKGTVTALLDEKDSPFRLFINNYVDVILASIKSDQELQGKIDKAIKEAIIMFVEKNHTVIGDMVRTSLDPGRLSDTQMVTEIEEKVGDDLQFIRLNGAVVGWFIGLTLGVIKAFL